MKTRHYEIVFEFNGMGTCQEIADYHIVREIVTVLREEHGIKDIKVTQVTTHRVEILV